ncbi:MAG: redox-regulated ATPase YchF [Candidatus Lightella neohaematopini]|nr:redox-regulated ATPase YchF [Candidatus Lightella neohaematopini]
MNIKCGIIGLPNVGKSTLFSLLTNNQVKIDNYPFCTINPNIGTVNVYDSRLYKIASIVNVHDIVFSKIQLIDTAGLIKNAANGIGLGVKILEQLNKVDIIYHVVRNFKKDNIHHMYNRICPIDDINIINTELILYDLIKCENLLNRLRCNIFNKNTIIIYEKLISYLSNNKMLRTLKFNDKEKNIINSLNFITLKPIIYIFNCDDEVSSIRGVENIIGYDKNTIIMNINFLKEKNINNVIKQSIIDKVNFKTYNTLLNKYNTIKLLIITTTLLNMITFFTFNKKEVRSWIIKNGTTALIASNKIHSDICSGFIKVQVINYNKFILINSKSQELIKNIPYIFYNKFYRIIDGDILKFIFR